MTDPASSSFFEIRSYPEPFSDKVPAQPDLLVASMERAHVEARAPYGDEGDGYDMALMVQVLLDHGWTPPARLLTHPGPDDPAVVAAVAQPFDSTRSLFPHLWETDVRDHTVSRLADVFAGAYPDNGPRAYETWCLEGYQFAELRAVLAFALGLASDLPTRTQVRAFAAMFGITLGEEP